MENLILKNLFKKRSLTLLLKIFIPGTLFLLLLQGLTSNRDFNFTDLSRDSIQVLNGKPYIGILSKIGVVFWCTTAAILFFSFKIVKNQGKPKNITYFLFFAGLLTLFLMVDDFFMFHDVIMPEYFNLDEKVFYFFYGLSFLALIYFFRMEILDSDYILLVLSGSFLGVSVITDVVIVLGLNVPFPLLIEDGFKFLGIISWFSYFTRTSYKHTSSVILKK